MLTNKTVEENADKRTQYKPEKVNNLKYSKTKLPWFSCLLQHSARTRGGIILQRSRAHTGRQVSECFDIDATGAVPGLKPDATAIEDPQDGRWKITLMFDGRMFCIPKFTFSTLEQTTR